MEGPAAHDPALVAVPGDPSGGPPDLGALPPTLHPTQHSLASPPRLPGLGLQPLTHGHTQNTYGQSGLVLCPTNQLHNSPTEVHVYTPWVVQQMFLIGYR